MKNFEIAWREELLERLQVPMNTLSRRFDKERQDSQKRIEELQKYSSPEEAHDAYGYGDITLEEYELICTDLAEAENKVTPVSAAKDELFAIMSRLKKDIAYFKWEALTDDEKQKLEQKNEVYKQELHNKAVSRWP